MAGLTGIEISLSKGGSAMLSFLLLQGLIKQLQESALREQVDALLLRLYQQFGSLQVEKEASQSRISQVMEQCAFASQQWKQGQQELAVVSGDRLRLVKQCRESADEAVKLLEENEQLSLMIASQQKLNLLLENRHKQMEGQLKSLLADRSLQSQAKTLSDDFSSMAKVSAKLQNELQQLGDRARVFEELSLPIRIVRVAFSSNNNLRELVLRTAEKELGTSPELREIFLNCSFDLGEPNESPKVEEGEEKEQEER